MDLTDLSYAEVNECGGVVKAVCDTCHFMSGSEVGYIISFTHLFTTSYSFSFSDHLSHLSLSSLLIPPPPVQGLCCGQQ